MNDELITSIANDLKIKKYSKENANDFQNRVIYTALSEWIRTIVLDEHIDEFDVHDTKTKHYITFHANRIVNEFFKIFPELEVWFRREEIEKKYGGVGKYIVNRLFKCGELIQYNDNKVGLPIGLRINISNDFERLYGYVGLDRTIEKIGLTSIVWKEKIVFDTPPTIPPAEYLENFLQNKTWRIYTEELSDLEILQRFRYENMSSIPTEKIFVVKKKLQYSADIYYLIKSSTDQISYIEIDRYLIELGEHFRLNIGSRKKNNIKDSIYFRENTDVILIKLPYRLPHIEMSMVYSLCWPLRNIADPRCFVVPKEAWGFIKLMLEGLDIIIEEEK